MGLHDLDMGLRFMGCLPATHKSKIRQYKAFNHKIPTGKDQIWSRKNLLFPSQEIRKFEPNIRNQSWQYWLHSRQTQRKEILLAPMEEELILNSISYWNETDSQSFDSITPAHWWKERWYSIPCLVNVETIPGSPPEQTHWFAMRGWASVAPQHKWDSQEVTVRLMNTSVLSP